MRQVESPPHRCRKLGMPLLLARTEERWGVHQERPVRRIKI